MGCPDCPGCTEYWGDKILAYTFEETNEGLILVVDFNALCEDCGKEFTLRVRYKNIGEEAILRE